MQPVLRAADFIGSIGVNVHLEYAGTRYANANAALADLQYLGLFNIREAATPSELVGETAYDLFADAGVKFNFVIPRSVMPADIVDRIEGFVREHPGSVVAIEGPNEINHWPVTYEGQTGVDAAVAFLNDIVAEVRATPLLAGIDIFDMTGAPRTAAVISDGSDFANIHPYARAAEQPMELLMAKLAGQQIAGKGMVITEAGYHTGTGNAGWEGVDEATQAKLTLNLLADAARLGISDIYLYQLLDPAPDPTGGDPDKNLGLFDLAGNPKLVATAIHNLTSILADDGAAAASFKPHLLDYTITGLPVSGNSMLIEKSSGVHELMIWAEPDIWNEDTHKPINVAAKQTTVDFDGNHVDVKVYDPLISDHPIATYANITSLQVAVRDHPVILEVTDRDGVGVLPGNPPSWYDMPLFLTGDSGYDDFIGGAGDDVIKGGGGADRINGASGDDQIIGGTGADLLTGGDGADSFIYKVIGDSLATAAKRDQIMDFSHAEGDRIDLSAIDANSKTFGNGSFVLGGNAFTKTAGQLIQTASGDGLLLQGDLNGDGKADFSIMLHNVDHPLVAADLIL